jgi:hypothetical protein
VTVRPGVVAINVVAVAFAEVFDPAIAGVERVVFVPSAVDGDSAKRIHTVGRIRFGHAIENRRVVHESRVDFPVANGVEIDFAGYAGEGDVVAEHAMDAGGNFEELQEAVPAVIAGTVHEVGLAVVIGEVGAEEFGGSGDESLRFGTSGGRGAEPGFVGELLMRPTVLVSFPGPTSGRLSSSPRLA